LLRVTLHQIRDQLIEGDSSAVLGLLMHYPDLPTVTPVLDYADMIKRYVCDLCTLFVVRLCSVLVGQDGITIQAY
jgi:hypothetical protein